MCQQRTDWRLVYGYVNQSFFLKLSESVLLLWSIHMSYIGKECNLLKTKFFFVCIATMKLLHYSQFLQTNLWKVFWPRCVPLLKKKKLPAKIVERRIQKKRFRHKTRCLIKTTYCPQCRNFLTPSQADLSFDIARNIVLSKQKTYTNANFFIE